MERGSDKHSARMDDALDAEVSGLMRAGHDSRADWNSPEPSGEDQPDVDMVPNGTLAGGVPDGMTEELVRRNLAGQTRTGKPDGLDELSDRELEVFRLTGHGLVRARAAGPNQRSSRYSITAKGRRTRSSRMTRRRATIRWSRSTSPGRWRQSPRRTARLGPPRRRRADAPVSFGRGRRSVTTPPT